MSHITTCTKCGNAYEASSEETANYPGDRFCFECRKSTPEPTPAPSEANFLESLDRYFVVEEPGKPAVPPSDIEKLRAHVASQVEAAVAEYKKAFEVQREIATSQQSERLQFKRERDEARAQLVTLLSTNIDLDAERARWDWFFGQTCKDASMQEYFLGVNEKWAPDRWREWANKWMNDGVEAPSSVTEHSIATLRADGDSDPAIMKMANEMRARCNSLTPEQREEDYQRGLKLIEQSFKEAPKAEEIFCAEIDMLKNVVKLALDDPYLANPQTDASKLLARQLRAALQGLMYQQKDLPPQ